MLKAIRAGFAAWLLPPLLGLVTTGIIAGSTSKLSGTAVGPWMFAAMGLQILLFVAGSAWLYRRLGHELKGGARIGAFLVHTLVQLALCAMILFATLVLFNR